MDPSPIPKFDNPKMDTMPACHCSAQGASALCGAAVYPRGKSHFDDHPFTVRSGMSRARSGFDPQLS
ncbi:alpha-D-ribose 1-methylphosphonate 5-phosphate C-P-lyase PhnJ [Escherichia coli]